MPDQIRHHGNFSDKCEIRQYSGIRKNIMIQKNLPFVRGGKKLAVLIFILIDGQDTIAKSYKCDEIEEKFPWDTH